MIHLLRRIGRDIEQRRHIDVYVVSAASVVLATLSLVGDVVSDDLRWAVVLAALGVLTFQVTEPRRTGDLDEVLRNRASFDGTTFGSRVRAAETVWILAPSAVNLLTADTADDLRKHVLARTRGEVRLLVLDPDAGEAVALAAHQLDDAAEFAAVTLAVALRATVERLRMMASWDVPGTFEARLMGFNAGFSMLAIDPYGKNGSLIVEFHGVRNESTASRMHVEITRSASEHWYVYWRDQFEHLWEDARPAATG